MRTFVFVMCFAAATLAAPKGNRDKRGFLESEFHLNPFESAHVGFPSYELVDFDHAHIEHAHIPHPVLSSHTIHKPIHKILTIKKVVDVPKLVEIKKVVSVPKLISVPQIVTSHKIVEDHSHSRSHYYPSFNSGWW